MADPGTMGPDDPGGGPIVSWDPPMRRWYNPEHMAPRNKPKEPDYDWTRILNAWVVVELDFHAIWGVDLEPLLHVRSFRWFRLRLIALLGQPNSKLRALLTQEVPADG